MGVDTNTLTFTNLVHSDSLPLTRKETFFINNTVRAAGTVLGRVTADSTMAPYTAAATHGVGTDTAVAILMEEAPVSAATQTLLVGYVGKYVAANLTGLTDAARLQLLAAGIVTE